MVFCPEQPKRDQNLKFTPLSETTSILAPFIWESPPRTSAAEVLRDPYLEEYHANDEPLAEPFDVSFEQWKDLGKDE